MPEKIQLQENVLRDEHHGHIITGDLRLITNTKRKLFLSKGPIYRESYSINYSKCKIAINSSIVDCKEKLETKDKFRDNDLKDWTDFTKEIVSKGIKSLRKNSYFYETTKILNSNFENVKTFLHNYQKQSVIKPLDKAANSFTFICTTFYISKSLNETGLNGTPNLTHEFYSKTKDEMVHKNSYFSNKFGLNLDKYI